MKNLEYTVAIYRFSCSSLLSVYNSHHCEFTSHHIVGEKAHISSYTKLLLCSIFAGLECELKYTKHIETSSNSENSLYGIFSYQRTYTDDDGMACLISSIGITM